MISIVNTATKAINTVSLVSAVSSIKNIYHPTLKSHEEITGIHDMLKSRSNEGSVDLLINDKLATITLNNPHKKNAITEKMMVDFYNCVNYLSEWNGNFIVLKGSNHTFCSGFDLQTACKYTSDPQGKVLLSTFMQDTCNRLKRLHVPSCSYVEGYAIGGGAEMTTSTDFRVMSPEAKVRFVHATLGLSPIWGGASRLSTIIGNKNALHYLCSANVITPTIGEKINYSDDTLTDEEFASFYTPYLKNFSGSIHAMKTVISQMEENTITPDVMSLERTVFEQLFDTKACLQGFQQNKVAKKYMKN